MGGTRTRKAGGQGWVLALTSAASFLIVLDGTVVTTALEVIRRDLGASIETLEWAMNAYLISFAVLMLPAAAIGDRFGRRRTYLAGIALFTAASAACALSPDAAWLVGARAVQGAGAAVIMPLSFTQLNAAYSPERRGRALGFFTGIVGIATFSGPFVGGAVAQGLAWQWIFAVNLPVGVAVMIMVPLKLAESTGPRRRPDVAGALLVTAGVLGVVWALVRGNRAGWASAEVLATLVGGLALVGAFVAWEGRVAAPMVPMRFFRIRALSAANVATFCTIGSVYGTLFFLAQYLQTVLGYGPFGAGLRLMPWTGTVTMTAPLAGMLIDRLGERWLVAGGLLLQTVGMGWLALIAAPDLAYVQMLPPLIVGGCGVSMAMPAQQKAVIGAVTPPEIGQASGVFSMLRQLGGVFGTAVAVAVFARYGGVGSPRAFTDGFGAAVGACAVMALVGALAALAIPGRRRPVPVEQPVTEADRDRVSVLS